VRRQFKVYRNDAWEKVRLDLEASAAANTALSLAARLQGNEAKSRLYQAMAERYLERLKRLERKDLRVIEGGGEAQE